VRLNIDHEWSQFRLMVKLWSEKIIESMQLIIHGNVSSNWSIKGNIALQSSLLEKQNFKKKKKFLECVWIRQFGNFKEFKILGNLPQSI
jgi:hypothetical protein